ncbi:MAG: MATE family efflux transporter [Acetatifactor sp.]|nr:MATE family efflux transporter [Acetatifactor sp.]
MNTAEKEHNNPLGYEKISTLLRKFAVPSIVAMLVSSLYNIVDQIFIGQGVGYLGNAATNVAFPLTTICLAIALLFGIGGAANFSLSLGSGDKEGAARTVCNVLYMVILFGAVYAVLIELFLVPMLNAFGATDNVLPFAVKYARITAVGMPFLIFTNAVSALIRADGSPKYSMMCMVTGAVINTVLDPLFIFGFQMGIEGAAWATILSQFVSFVCALRYLWRLQSIALKKEHFQIQADRCIQIASLGMSNSLTQVSITLIQIVMNNSLTYYGVRSIYGEDIPLSAAGIVMKVNSILTAVFVGLSQGSQPILGYNYGAVQYERVKGVYRLAVKCSFVVSVLGFIMFQFFPEYIIIIFGSGDNELYLEFAVKFMRTFLFMIIINGVQLISSNFFSAIGKPFKGIMLSLSRQVIFLIPLMLILPVFLGIDGIMLAAPVADAIAFVFSIVMIRKEFSKMSLPDAGIV